jgi:hypothetical protein
MYANRNCKDSKLQLEIYYMRDTGLPQNGGLSWNILTAWPWKTGINISSQARELGFQNYELLSLFTDL